MVLEEKDDKLSGTDEILIWNYFFREIPLNVFIILMYFTQYTAVSKIKRLTL